MNMELLALLLPAAVALVVAVLAYRQTVRLSDRQNTEDEKVREAEAEQARERARDAPYASLVTRIGQQDTRLDHLSTSLDELRESARRLSQRVEQQDIDIDVLTDALWVQHQWQQAGAMPPPPTISSSALELIHDRRTKAKNEAR